MDSAILEQVAREAGADSGVEPERLGPFLAEVLLIAQSGDRLSSAQLERLSWEGDKAAREGIALPRLLDLYLSALWRLFATYHTSADSDSSREWRGVPSDRHRAESSWNVPMTLLRAGDDAAAAIAEGFAAAQQRSLQFDAAGRRELFEDLLAGSHDPHLLAERANSFGFNLAASHHVLVAETQRDHFDSGPLPTRVESLLRSEFGVTDGLVATKNGRLVLVLPGQIGPMETRLAEFIAAESHSDDAVVGAGSTHPGVLGVRQSYEEAIEAVEIAGIAGRSAHFGGSASTRLVLFSSLVPQRLLRSNPLLSAELVSTVLGPLNAARNSGDHLMETLAALASSGGNISAAARQLHVSPRAVSYRVQRIVELTSYSPLEPEGRFVLELARQCALLERQSRGGAVGT